MSFEAVYNRLNAAYPAFINEAHDQALKKAYNNTAAMTREVFYGFLDLIKITVNGMYVSHWLDTRTVTSEIVFRRYLDSLDIIRMPITSFSAQQAAETLKLSYSQLNRLSNTMLGMPFKQYILHEKIKAASIILGTSTSCSVKDAAHAVGIEDAHYFSRLFRKYMGCSCMEYQNTHLGF